MSAKAKNVCVGGWVFVLVNPYCTLGTKCNILVLAISEILIL